MAVYVGRWDCNSCGFKGVEGPKTECPNCGADRPKNVKFYLADEKDIVQDPEVLKKAKSGADWRCSFCGENNKAYEPTCKSCGNNRSAGDKNLEVKTYDTKDVPRDGNKTVDDKATQTFEPTPVATKTKSKWDKKKILTIAGVLIGIIVILMFNRSISVTVEGFDWSRTIKVEEYKLVTEEDWSVPSGGTETGSHQAIHHYNKILDHYETRTRTKQRATGSEEYVCGKTDMGNGYFEDKYCTRTIYESYDEQYEEPIYRDEPVYQTKYTYTIYRWKPANSILTSAKDHNPYWGNTDNIQDKERFREAGRSGIFGITVKDEKNVTHHHEIPEARWTKLKMGEKLPAKRGLVTGGYRGIIEN